MSEEKIIAAASDLPISYVPYTNDGATAIYYPTSISTKCALCEERFSINSYFGDYARICPRCKKVWKNFLAIYDDAPVKGEN